MPPPVGQRASPSAAIVVQHLARGANVGHAHVITVTPDGTYAGATDARALSGAAVGV